MKSCFYIALTGLYAAVCGQSLPKVDALKWKHYSGGYVIDLPNLFEYGLRTNSGIEWFRVTDTSVHGGYELCVDCGEQEQAVVDSFAIKASYEKRKQWSLADGDRIAYELLKPNYFVLSGTLKEGNDETIWYLKGINRKGSYYELSVRYEPQYKTLFDTILPRIAGSFH